MAVTAYGSITPTQAAYSAKVLLERAIPYLILEQIGQLKPLPANNTKTISFRRHKLAAVATQIGANGEVLTAGNLTSFQLSEGTTPTELGTTMQNVDVTLAQYGAVIGITDVIEETHIDDVLTEYMGLLGENSGQVIEAMRWIGISGDAGVNVILAQDTAGVSAATEAAIKIPAGPAEFRAAVRSIRSNHGRPITKVVKSDVRFGTQACEPSFVCVMHSDMEGTLRKTLGANFTPVADYGSSMTPLQGEFGNFENIRFLSSTLIGKRANGTPIGGGASTSALIAASPNLQSDAGVNVNLYDLLVFAADAWCGVALKGEYAVTPTLIRATPSESDPLAQRSKAGYKTMQAVKVLQTAHIKKIVSGSYKDALLD